MGQNLMLFKNEPTIMKMTNWCKYDPPWGEKEKKPSHMLAGSFKNIVKWKEALQRQHTSNLNRKKLIF